MYKISDLAGLQWLAEQIDVVTTTDILNVEFPLNPVLGDIQAGVASDSLKVLFYLYDKLEREFSTVCDDLSEYFQGDDTSKDMEEKINLIENRLGLVEELIKFEARSQFPELSRCDLFACDDTWCVYGMNYPSDEDSDGMVDNLNPISTTSIH